MKHLCMVGTFSLLILSTTACSGGGSDPAPTPPQVGSPPVPPPAPPPPPPPPANTAPVYDGPTTFIVAENDPWSQQLSASDSDGDALTYRLNAGEDEQHFEITNDGRLTVDSPFDYETPTDANLDNVFNITVIVSDAEADTEINLSVFVRNVYANYGLIYGGSDYTFEILRDAPHEMLIIDPARSITDVSVIQSELLWTSEQVNQLKQNRERTLIGYLNASIINSYRHYWDTSWTLTGRADSDLSATAPAWLGERIGNGTDDVFFGRFVRLETDLSEWQSVLEGRLDVLIDQGFDGVFIDDVLRYFSEYGTDTIPITAHNMRDLIIGLSEYTKAKDPDFQIIVNGAPFILGDTNESSPQNDLYYDSLDGILGESYFVPEDTVATQQTISAFGAQGIVMLALQPNLSGSNVADFFEAADERGFIPYASSTGYLSLNDPFGKTEVGSDN